MQYFANIGKANLDVLQRGSSQRKRLLLEALACLVCGEGTAVHEAAENLGSLLQRDPVLFNTSFLYYSRKSPAQK